MYPAQAVNNGLRLNPSLGYLKSNVYPPDGKHTHPVEKRSRVGKNETDSHEALVYNQSTAEQKRFSYVFYDKEGSLWTKKANRAH